MHNRESLAERLAWSAWPGQVAVDRRLCLEFDIDPV